MTPRPGQTSVAGNQGAVQRVGEHHVRGVIGGDTVAEVKRAASQLVRARPAVNWQILEIGE